MIALAQNGLEVNYKMKIKLYSQYRRFNDFQEPKYIQWDPDGQIEAYHDVFISAAIHNKNNGKKKIAIITEPRCVWQHVFGNFDIELFLKRQYNLFQYIFTFDNEILKLPNAKPIGFPGIWYSGNEEKTKYISICCSNKSMCPSHLKRKIVADKLKNKVDVLGDYLGEARVSTKDIYSQYKYSVVLENDCSYWYYTEKVINAFANKCIPIYYGTPRILELFNPKGIIFVENLDKIEEIIDNLNPHYYEENIDAVNENFELAKKYSCYEDCLYLDYQKELEDLWKY